MKVLINGGGIAGLTCAIALNKLGIETEVYEAAAEIKPAGAGLVLQSNAIKALEYLGIEDKIIEAGNPVNQLAIYEANGRIIKRQRPDSKYREKFGGIAIHRHTLHEILKSYLDDNIFFLNKRAQSFSDDGEKVVLRFDDGTEAEGDYLISADGINSVIRQKLVPDSKPRYAGYLCWRAVVENNFGIKEASETWGKKGRFGIVPINENNIYWFAVITGHQFDSKLNNFTVEDIAEHFSGFHKPVSEILSSTPGSALIFNSISDLEPLNRFAYNNVLLTGDAAHAVTPNLGQGACQAIEDMMVLHQEISVHKDLKTAFKSFEQRRLARTKFITETSRKMGAMAQSGNTLLMAIRNFLFRMIPEFVTARQLNKIYN